MSGVIYSCEHNQLICMPKSLKDKVETTNILPPRIWLADQTINLKMKKRLRFMAVGNNNVCPFGNILEVLVELQGKL